MEKQFNASNRSGYFHVILNLAAIVFFAVLMISQNPFGLILIPFWILHLRGFFALQPNKSIVLILFGKYKGTVKENGFYWVNPFMVRKSISLRAANLDSKPIKVNDKLGNPIIIGVILVWKVKDTYKAAFDVNDFKEFVFIQTDAAIRKLANAYPYDNFDEAGEEISLRSGLEVINHELENEMRERLSIAGVEVIEARISHLAYAQEIAGAMLQRQQATAIIAARRKIVEGAVGMVDMALHELSVNGIIELDDDKKAAMISNLMVVLCSDKAASPVVNTGTLYQ